VRPESVNKVTGLIDMMKDSIDIDLWEVIIEGLIDRFTATGIGKRPADVIALFLDRDVFILA